MRTTEIMGDADQDDFSHDFDDSDLDDNCGE